ncbi:hypothetical protein RDI58_024521 [Solanum bulbocastanum]|uniref:Uncharacterized protein n=1 Tax=Solanum bulbocastanum TaxID=147425 RepID=A0AAN8T544_SOLBU
MIYRSYYRMSWSTIGGVQGLVSNLQITEPCTVFRSTYVRYITTASPKNFPKFLLHFPCHLRLPSTICRCFYQP